MQDEKRAQQQQQQQQPLQLQQQQQQQLQQQQLQQQQEPTVQEQLEKYDLVTVIQQQVEKLAETMFNSVGVLQRDSQPIPLQGAAPTPQYPPGCSPAEFADAVSSRIVAIDQLLQQLPPLEQSDAELKEEILTLFKKRGELQEELSQTRKIATEKLLEFDRVYQREVFRREFNQGEGGS